MINFYFYGGGDGIVIGRVYKWKHNRSIVKVIGKYKSGKLLVKRHDGGGWPADDGVSNISELSEGNFAPYNNYILDVDDLEDIRVLPIHPVDAYKAPHYNSPSDVQHQMRYIGEDGTVFNSRSAMMASNMKYANDSSKATYLNILKKRGLDSDPNYGSSLHLKWERALGEGIPSSIYDTDPAYFHHTKPKKFSYDIKFSNTDGKIAIKKNRFSDKLTISEEMVNNFSKIETKEINIMPMVKPLI